MQAQRPAPPPDAALTRAQVAAAPVRLRTLDRAPAEGREWALVRMVAPGTALDGRIAWADLPAGTPAAARVFERFGGPQPADGRARVRPLGWPAIGSLALAGDAWLLADGEADAADRAFAWGVLLASDAALADIAADAARGAPADAPGGARALRVLQGGAGSGPETA